jgi:hypothetical protein
MAETHQRSPRKLLLAPLAGLFLGLLFSSAVAQEPSKGKGAGGVSKGKDAKKVEKKKEDTKAKPFHVFDEVTARDPVDADRGCLYKAYPYKMVAGTTYVIDMIDQNGPAGSMDPFLRLVDSTGKQHAYDDDGGEGLNSRIVFLAPKTDDYTVKATTCSSGRTGRFMLQIRPLGPGEAPPIRGMGSLGPGLGIPMTYGDVTVRHLARPNAPSFGGSSDDGHGYLEYRFLVENKSETDSHEVTLTFPRFRGASTHGYFLRSVSRTVKVGPQETMPVSLFQPEMRFLYSSDLEVAIDGKSRPEGLMINVPQNRGARFSNSMGPSGASSGVVSILATADLVPHLNNNVQKSAIREPPVFTRSGATGNRSIFHNGKHYTYFQIHRFNATTDPLDAWSARWLGYSCYDGVVLAGPKLQAAPADVKNTLWKYVEAGGSLLLLGKCEVPEGWSRRKAELNKMIAYYPGFGQCLVCAEEDIAKWDPAQWIQITDMWDGTAQPWQNNVLSPTAANRALPVVENLGVPVRGLFSMMLLFTALIGPVNIYVLGRKRRRIWMLWTVPAFSLVTCVLLFGFMLLSEGWHGHVRAEGATFLDETSQRAASIGWMGFYSPMTPGDGLRFSDNTELTPHFRMDPHHYRRQNLPLSITWSDDVQHLDSGWLTARVPAHFLVRNVERRLERLIVTKDEDGSFTVLNSFKAPIRSLWLADQEGRIYTAENVAKGSRGALKRAGQEKAGGRPEALRNAYQRDWSTLLDATAGSAGALLSPATVLTPGCYVAVVDGAPFFEDGLRSAQTRKGRSVVFGVMKEPI